MAKEFVVLVNEHDQEIGQMEKMQAHEDALLHRAVSVFVVNAKNEWLLQQRAIHKYHSGGLWTNACCTHPQHDETVAQAAERRLQEELGIGATLHKLFHFIYFAPLDHGLTEHELDHVYVGYSNEMPQPNLEEVMNVKYCTADEILADIKLNPTHYTAWFKKIAQQVSEELTTTKHLNSL